MAITIIILQRQYGLLFEKVCIKERKVIKSMEKKYREKFKKAGKRKYIGLLMCIILLFSVCCVGCSNTNSNSNTNTSGYLDAKNGVVVVTEYVALDGKVEGAWHGSGFFVGKEGEDPQYLITNHHVIADYLYYGAGQNATFIDENSLTIEADGTVHSTTYAVKSYVRVYYDSDDYVEAYVVGYNEVADVAVLRLEEPTTKRRALQLCSPTGDMVGSNVYAIGFPGIADNNIVDAVTSWGLKDLTYTSGVISRLTTTSGTGVRNIQVDVTIAHGNSGGPVVNENGSAVGICTWGVRNEDAEEATYAVNIDEVITLLNLYDVPYTMESESSAKGIKPNIGIVAGAVVLLIIIVVIVCLLKNKKKSSSSEYAENSAGATTVPEMSAPAPAPASRSSNSDDSGYRLQGLSGVLEGRRFMIRKNSPLTIGRNSEICNVVFPAATAGISGKHCQVWYDGGKIWIKDLGSSHGTFLTAGERLSAGQAVQIKPGERFSLGSGAESFVLTQKGGN